MSGFRGNANISRRKIIAAAAAAGAFAALPADTQQADAQQAPRVKVLSAGSTLYGVRPAAAAFARASGLAVAVATDHGHNIEKAALADTADADVVLVPNAMLAKLVAAGRVAGEPVAIGAVRMGAAVREDAPRPDVSTMDALRRSFVAATQVLLTLAPTGDHLMQVIARFGLTDTIAPKLRRFDTATLLNRHLAENATPGMLGFGPSTEILAWRGKGVAWGGAVPDEIQIVLPYQAAVLSRAGDPEAARRLLAFLGTPEARAHFLASGVE